MNLDTNIPLQARTPEPLDPLGALSKVLTLRNQQTEGSIRDLQLQQAQQGQADTKAIDSAFAGNQDRAAILASVPGHLKAHVQQVFKQADEDDAKVKKAQQDAETAETDYFAGLAAGVKPFVALSPEQGMAAVKTALDLAKAHGHEGTDELWQQIQANPDHLPQIIDGLMAKSPKYASQIKAPAPKGDYTLGDTRYSGETNKPLVSAPPKPEKPPTLGSLEDFMTSYARDTLKKPATEMTAADKIKAKEAFDAAGRAPQEPDTALNLTPEGRDLVANQFAMTGLLPPMGNGKEGAKVRTQIINRAAEMYSGLDLASQRAAYEANKKALTTMQPQLDAITAWESTASKNLDQFLATASKIADSGSPLINKPIRAFSDAILGNPDMSAYETARRTVIPEFAKILNNPNLTGQLSDSARKEVEDLMKGDATLKQTVAVAKILTQDVKNRHASLTDQIAAIKKRIATAPGGAATAETEAGPKEGDTKPIPGYPGTEQKFTNGKWIRTK